MLWIIPAIPEKVCTNREKKRCRPLQSLPSTSRRRFHHQAVPGARCDQVDGQEVSATGRIEHEVVRDSGGAPIAVEERVGVNDAAIGRHRADCGPFVDMCADELRQFRHQAIAQPPVWEMGRGTIVERGDAHARAAERVRAGTAAAMHSIVSRANRAGSR